MKEIITVENHKENITIACLYYQLIHEKNLYFAAATAVAVVEFFANFGHAYSVTGRPNASHYNSRPIVVTCFN